MEQKTRNKSLRLAQKLKKAVQNLNVDVFGYESKVRHNIITYFSRLSKETRLQQDHLVVRMFRDRETIFVGMYNHGRLVKRIPVSELIMLFTNSKPSGLFDLEAKVTKGMNTFMSEFSKGHSMNVDQLQICIVTDHDKVWVKGYKGIEFVQDIPLGVLIKHFMQ